MGWASAAEIFDPVAQGLLDAKASGEIKRRVLGPLIGKLLGEDWDTADYSLEQFRGDPVIVEVFAEHGITLASGTKEESCRGFRWIGQSFASCDGCGRPAWEHEGVMRLRDGASLSGIDADIWELRPWEPGEADAIRQKWARHDDD